MNLSRLASQQEGLVNAAMTRDRLVRSHGFCRWHAWILPGIANSGTGVAVLSRPLLDVARSVLEIARQVCRVEYEIEATAAGIREMALPGELSAGLIAILKTGAPLAGRA